MSDINDRYSLLTLFLGVTVAGAVALAVGVWELVHTNAC